MSLQVDYFNGKVDNGFKLLENICDPILIFEEGVIVFANKKAADLFEYDFQNDMLNLKLVDITSEFEKKSKYVIERDQDFLGGENEIESHRFRWIHKKKSGKNFYSEVISVQLPECILDSCPDCKCVVISDLDEWNELKTKAEQNFLSSRNIINNLTEAILIIDPESGVILDTNIQASNFYGYTVHQLRKLNISDINILSSDEIKIEMQKAKGEKRGHFLFKHRLASGDVVDVKVLSGPIKYHGKTALYSIITDINEPLTQARVAGYNRISTSEQNIFESLFHNLQIPVAVFNPDMRIRAVNAAFLSEFEYQIQDVLNRHITPLICPWEYVEEAEFFHELVQKGNNIFEEVYRKSKSGRIKTYKINGFPLMYNGVTSAVVGVYLDVDAEKKAAFKLQLINKIFENIDEGMLITDPNGVIIWVNQAFQRITGFSLSESMGQKPDIMLSRKQDSLFYQSLWHELLHDGYWEGEVNNKKRTGELYQAWLTIAAVKDKKDQVTNYISVMNDITKYKAQEAKIKHLAKTDTLTGLMNRATFIKRAEKEMLATPKSVKQVILLLDLDEFVKINDIYGHDQGDQVLKTISYRLQSTFKSKDILARIGGDEFIVLLKDIEIGQISGIIERLVRVIGRPIELDDQVVKLDASIGGAVYPIDADNLADLMKDADIALYHAKEIQGSSFEFYSKEIENRFNTLNRMEESLKQAVELDEFDVFYQGVVGQNCNYYCSAEALLRWNNTEMGRVSPEIFIPIAERIGIMPEIGYWVLERVLQNIQKWSFGDYLSEGIAVNISVTQLEERGFCNQVKILLEKYNVPPELLEFEITESVYIRNFDKVVSVLDELHGMGIRLTMDDFGTGYSSLSTIHKLKLSKIKIDRSFIKDLPDHDKSVELTHSIINLAQNLNCSVVAEGVEREEQVKFLREHNCDYIQGYFFAKPVNCNDFVTLLGKALI